MTAEELAEKRFQQERADLDKGFQNEWQMTVQRFGPASRNPNIEEARRRALANLRIEQADKANTFTAKYNKMKSSLKEVDSLISDPAKAAEVKLRMSVPPELESAVFPKVKDETDPQKEFDAAYLHGQKIEAGLKKFRVREKRNVEGTSWLRPWALGGGWGSVEVQGGGVDVITEPSRMVGGVRTTPKSREATQEEIQEWAGLTEEQRRNREEKQTLLAKLRKSDPSAARIQTAAAMSPRMGNMGPLTREETGGTFAQKVTAVSTEGRTLATPNAVYAKNPKTGERVVTYDGGKTWQAAK